VAGPRGVHGRGGQGRLQPPPAPPPPGTTPAALPAVAAAAAAAATPAAPAAVSAAAGGRSLDRILPSWRLALTGLPPAHPCRCIGQASRSCPRHRSVHPSFASPAPRRSVPTRMARGYVDHQPWRRRLTPAWSTVWSGSSSSRRLLPGRGGAGRSSSRCTRSPRRVAPRPRPRGGHNRRVSSRSAPLVYLDLERHRDI
jgi:hypothetical protein